MNVESINGSPVRLKRSLFGRLYIEIQETSHHVRDLAGSGYYDEWDTTHWRKAKLSELKLADLIVGD